MSLRSTMQKDLAKLIGQLPVYCGYTAAAQTIPCAWLSQSNEVRFASIGVLGEDTVQIIVAMSDMPTPPAPQSLLYVSGHRYRVRTTEPIDCVSLRITLDRSDL
jgi:hypothetical protein